MNDKDRNYPSSKTGQPIALEARDVVDDGRLFSPSIGRNKDDVRDVFLTQIPHNAHVLEVASGTGEHGVHMTNAAEELTWTYSDIDETSMVSQRAWAAHVQHNRLRGPLRLDMLTDWADGLSGFDAMFCANMIHIAPFEAAIGLFEGAGKILPPAGRLVLYGPFARRGQIAPSNLTFSQNLKQRDPSWGVRDLDEELLPLANLAGLTLVEAIQMPANNLSVIFEKS